MDAMVFLGFFMAAFVGVAFLALVLKYLDMEEQRAAPEERPRTPDDARMPQAIAEQMPAFFGTAHARLAGLGYNERMPVLHEIDHRHVLWAVEQAGGNAAHAAQLLGISAGTFERLLEHYCGPSVRANRAADADARAAAAAVGQHEVFEDRLFVFVQNYIQAEQDVVTEFVHLPSIDSLYRPARPTFFAR